jgi:hypothetical protein
VVTASFDDAHWPIELLVPTGISSYEYRVW